MLEHCLYCRPTPANEHTYGCLNHPQAKSYLPCNNVGWRCPKCGRCLSPVMLVCPCGPGVEGINTTLTNGRITDVTHL